MKPFRLTISCLFVLLICGCMSSPTKQTNVLLAEVQSVDCPFVQGFLNYENDTIRVAYIFWAENGLMGLFVHNKLQRPLYIDWKKCSYITGDLKHDYWNETVTMENSGTSTSSSVSASQSRTFVSGYSNTTLDLNSKTEYWKNNFWTPDVMAETNTTGDATTISKITASTLSTNQYLQSTFNYSYARITKLERITFIPPAATVSVDPYSICENEFRDIPSSQFVTKDTTVFVEGHVLVKISYQLKYDSLVWQPKKVNISSVEFSQRTSPLSFRSFITYSTDENFSTEGYVDNAFYVARITQMSIPIFEARKDGKLTEGKRNMWAKPNRFYVFKRVDF